MRGHCGDLKQCFVMWKIQLIVFSLLLCSVTVCKTLTCYHLPRHSILNKGNNSISSCDPSNLTPDGIKQWNENLNTISSYFQYKDCVHFKENFILKNKTCMEEVTKQFLLLKDKPMCCSITENNGTYGCYSNKIELCKTMNTHNNANEGISLVSAICNGEVHKHAKCLFKEKMAWKTCEQWNNAILPMAYNTMGCYSKASDLPGVASGYDDSFSADFMVKNFCHGSGGGGSCCQNRNMCNAPTLVSAATFSADAVQFCSLSRGPSPQHSGRPSLLAVALGLTAALGLCTAGLVAFLLVGGCGLLRRAKRRFLPTASSAAGVAAAAAAEQSQRANHTAASAAAAGGDCDQPEVELLPLHQERQRRRSSSSSNNNNSSSSCSSSGAGNPNLVRRTIARETTVLEPIGQGRFGQVFKAVWRSGDLVAVKLFHSRAEASWSREGEIYSTPGVQHPAILGFVAIDNLDAGWETQLWLVTQYQAHGSLQSYLAGNSISAQVACRMCHSVVSGLAHLHTELLSASFRKPRIAHCDLKSNNVLVKPDLTCCLADFGLAVRDTDDWVRGGDRRVGTARYLSPELLDGSIGQQQGSGGGGGGDISALTQADIYALGLVLWEIGNRCLGAYQLPYDGLVGQNPSVDDMRQLVCPPANRRPPTPPDAWQQGDNNALTAALASELLPSCWQAGAASRAGAMLLKQRTARLLLQMAAG